VSAAWSNSVWRCAENLDERRHRAAAPAFDDMDSNAFAGDGEWNGQPAFTGGCDAITVRRERLDLYDSGTINQLTLRSSTSKTSVAFGGITPPAPWAP
jgi:hypothetical protein